MRRDMLSCSKNKNAGRPPWRPAETTRYALAITQKLVDRIALALNVTGTVLILGLVVLINTDVLGRNLFLAPIPGVPEIVSMSIVAIVFLQAAHAFRMGRFTRTDAILNLVDRLSPRFRTVLEAVFNLAAAWVIWELLWASYPLFEKAWGRGTYVGTVGNFIAPVWPIKLVLLIGCAVLFLQIVIAILRALISTIESDNSASTQHKPFDDAV